jgi:hypothetical protein
MCSHTRRHTRWAHRSRMNHPHTAKHLASSYHCTCVRILLYVCLQATYPRGASLSHATISLIDSEVADLVQLAWCRAKQILVDNRQSLTSLTAMLLEKETVTGEEKKKKRASPSSYTATNVFWTTCHLCVRMLLLMCVRILLLMCLHTATNVSAYCC